MLTLYFNNRPMPAYLPVKYLLWAEVNQVSQFNPDTSFGDLSAVIMKNLPLWAEFYRTPHMDIALLDRF